MGRSRRTASGAAELADSPAWRFACPDWEERLRKGRSLLPNLPLDPGTAARAVAIFNKLRLPDVPGQPPLGEAAGDWQRDIVRAVFGSLGPHGRQVREVFNLVPKKNSKTTGGAAIMLTALLENKRPRAEFVLVGPTQEVADTAFQQAVGMIEADLPEEGETEGYLKKRFQVQEHVKTIKDRLTKARLKIKTFDLKVATGSKPVGVLIDELHVMSQMSFATRVVGQLRGGLVANPEAFLIFITTQSEEPPAGVFKQELDYARAVRDGRITEDVRMLPLLYEFPEAMQTDKAKPWADPKNWPMVMPNLGRSITIERLVPEYRTAKEKSEEEECRWASQHLNVQIGMALHSDRWRGADYWRGAADESITLDTLIARCDVTVVGIDGGGLDDLLGLTVFGRDKRTRDWLSWSKAWCQSDVLKLRKDIAERLRDFAKAGDLVLCDEPPSRDVLLEGDQDAVHYVPQDVKEVADICAMLRDAGLLPEKHAVGLDPIGVSAIVDELAERKIDGEQIVGIAQGYRLSGAVWGLERKLKDGTFWHADQPMMDWCVGNAKVEQRGNAVLITKQAAGKAKIDPLVAAFDAAMLMSRNPEGAPRVDLNEWLAHPVMV